LAKVLIGTRGSAQSSLFIPIGLTGYLCEYAQLTRVRTRGARRFIAFSFRHKLTWRGTPAFHDKLLEKLPLREGEVEAIGAISVKSISVRI
jgi:hypothetical protein